MLVISNLKQFQSSSKKITLTPNLKEFNKAIVKVIEEVIVIGSYWRITVLDMIDMFKHIKSRSHYLAR